MSTNKTLAFRVASEIDDLTCSCEWTPELRALIKKRHQAVKAMLEVDDTGSFYCAQWFWYGLDVCESHEDMDDILPEYHEPYLLDGDEDEDPLPEMVGTRVDVMLMIVTNERVHFKFALKHTNEYLEGGSMELDDPEFFPAEEVA